MEIVSILNDVEYGEQQPVIKLLLNTPSVKEVRIVFKTGQEMKAHKAGFPIVVEIVEGSIDFGVGEKRYMLGKGMLIALEANVPHDLVAQEDSIVRLSINKADSVARVQQAANA